MLRGARSFKRIVSIIIEKFISFKELFVEGTITRFEDWRYSSFLSKRLFNTNIMIGKMINGWSYVAEHSTVS